MQRCVITVYRMLSDTLAKMDGLSEKDTPSPISPALPLKKPRVKDFPSWFHSWNSPWNFSVKDGGSPERKGGEKEKRVPAPSKTCCSSTPLHWLRRLYSKGGKKLQKLGKGKYVSVTIAMLVFWDTHTAPDSGGTPSLPFLEDSRWLNAEYEESTAWERP